ncbi:NAD(P)-binding protein [Thioalkalivibrio sp.]|uniref:NAD(P)-binding protein n=1 Tax=Thioalkalivibrio sp. TaxID=2093813 RepID=UPI003569DA60
MKIAIIGAGRAGLSAANRLREAGADCTVFEKSRGLGGRMATRRVGSLQFDHGAQYFTARGARFAIPLGAVADRRQRGGMVAPDRGVHRWLYARVEQAAGVPFLWNPVRQMGACRDWAGVPRVECAFDSGEALASAIIDARA